MAKQPEARFKNKIVPLIRKLPNTDGFIKEAGAIIGLLDSYWCINGRFVGLEFKKDLQETFKNDRRTIHQRRTIEKIIAAGGYAKFVYPENWEETYADLSAIALGPERPPLRINWR
jgi:hypothetical protein